MTELRVIASTEILALRMTEEAHSEDHRLKINDVPARVITSAFIPGGNRVAKRVIHFCTLCRQASHNVPTSDPLGSEEKKPLSPEPPHSHEAEGGANTSAGVKDYN